MKKIVRLIIFLVLIYTLIPNGNAAENDYGKVIAWCNDEPATVNDLKIKIGEPITIKVQVTSKIYGFIGIELNEPGVTRSYDIISGPSDFDKGIYEYDVESGWKNEYIWIIAPNGEWTDGNAPINLYVQFNQDIDEVERVQFTIVNPIILDEHYSGPAPTRTTTDPSSSDQPPSQGSPGFGVACALLWIALVLMARRS
ncbi:MAG: sarcinarray family MAST domain-containing protein [ANME-2 cluster archaeon]|nr:sarcinarray family MAST domain-containing protein [ANME-2 cluster archaeon]MBC2707091.1 sarcinarray family MAST domain-containing protein [ANME-2 cluster archaeon]